MAVDPYVDGPIDPDKDPYDSNQAIPTLLFGKPHDRQAFERRFEGLAAIRTERLALLIYPLSGGFRTWSLVPAGMVRPLNGLERLLVPVLGWLAAFRLLIVVERRR